MFPDNEPREPIGTYQVWHKDGDWFRHVANVEAGNLFAALVLPSYISKDHEEYKRVTSFVDELRPNTFGDVIVNPANVAYEIHKPDCGEIGFRRIDFLQEQFRAVLVGDGFQKYEKHLNEATERALARMQGNEGREI
jgi:hypothetical protein